VHVGRRRIGSARRSLRRTHGRKAVLRPRHAALASMGPRKKYTMGPEDAGLVGTPYFWTGIAAVVAAWVVVMLALWAV